MTKPRMYYSWGMRLWWSCLVHFRRFETSVVGTHVDVLGNGSERSWDVGVGSQVGWRYRKGYDALLYRVTLRDPLCYP